MNRSDLLISDAEQTSLTKALASVAQPDPITACIAEKEAIVEGICGDMDASFRTPHSALRNQITRALVLYQLYSLIGPIPANVKEAYTEASKLLEQIKSGAYPPPTAATKRRRREFKRSDQEGL